MTLVKIEVLGRQYLLASFECGCSLLVVGGKGLCLLICLHGLELSDHLCEVGLEAVWEPGSRARTVRSMAPADL